VKGVISGWTEALLEMRVGERRRLWLPDKLAYPNLRAHPTIWVFEVELLEVLRGKAPPPAPSEVAVAPADAIKTGSGLAYKLITTGEGDDKPKAWDRVKLRYTGWGKDGAVIEDSSGVFELAKVMPGWREALQLVAAGDRVRVWLPAVLAQPKHKEDTLYELELLSVEHMPEPPRALTPPKDALTSKSGLSFRWNTRGERGSKPTLHDRVVMTYNAWTSDGELFDSSSFRGKPSSYPMRGLIPGWAEGLQLMSPGDKATFWIPEPLAYQGREGAPQGALIYEVELHDILSREGSSTHP
jgi:peptidylprolyl isomerase